MTLLVAAAGSRIYVRGIEFGRQDAMDAARDENFWPFDERSWMLRVGLPCSLSAAGWRDEGWGEVVPVHTVCVEHHLHRSRLAYTHPCDY
jgi:hypothetical protein